MKSASKHAKPETRHSIGTRRNAEQIIARASLLSCLCVLVCATVFTGIALYILSRGSQACSSPQSIAVSAAAASLIVVGANLTNWASIRIIPQWFPRLQGLAFGGGFLVKAAAVCLVLALIWRQPWFHAPTFFISFACALVLSLSVLAAVVLREQGPDLDSAL